MKLKDIINIDDETDDFLEYDLSEIQEVLQTLKEDQPYDIAQAERLSQMALRGADVASEYLGKITAKNLDIKAKYNRAKNKGALEFTGDGGKAPSMELRKLAGENSSEADRLSKIHAQLEGAKTLIELKHESLIKSHHHYKDIAMGMRKITPGNGHAKQTGTDWDKY